MERLSTGKRDIQGNQLIYKPFRRTEPFDWYQNFAGIKDILTQYIKPNDRILNLGCGNSRLSEEMYEDGFETITNIDFSNKVIGQMEEKLKLKCPKMSWKVMDVLEMKEFSDGEFTAIIDKATMDSVLCGDNSGPNVEKMMKEVNRVLAPGGHFLVISYGDPTHRNEYLQKGEWGELIYKKLAKPSASVAQVPNTDENDVKNFHYAYIMTKKAQ